MTIVGFKSSENEAGFVDESHDSPRAARTGVRTGVRSEAKGPIVGTGPIAGEAGFVADNTVLPRVARPEQRPSQRPASEGLWIIDGVAEYLRLPVSSIYKMTAAKAAVRLPHIRIGGSLRFRKTDVDRWLELLSNSNLDVLERARQKGIKAAHGHHP